MKLILLDVQLYTILGISTAVTLAILAALFYYVPIGLWVTAQFSGVRISIGQLIGMRLRRVQPKAIVDEMIKLKKARIEGISLGQLEAHFLANGDVNKVVDALISASNAHINLNFESASAIDLAGRDILQAVKDSVNTKVIDAPPVEAVAKDGIQLIVKSRITVRAQIERLVGGAGEETVVARVGQGIVGAIGSADTHETIMADPSLISERLLSEGFSAGLAYDILSIDIADIDVGQSVGARLKADEALARATCSSALA
ncbi:MAG: flotillin-like FloA family protein, partial [Bacteroidota bacterium]